MSLIVISTDRFADHQTPPGHPECSERAEVMHSVASAWRRRGGEVVAPREASREQLTRVHDSDYVTRIGETAGTALALDPDTYTSSETHEVALLAAGAAIDAVERVLGGEHQRAFALVRPPGHHAERARAMGFCFYNNVAVAAAHARALGTSRVAIVDYDVHHGNGTQHIFEHDLQVLYASIHQYPYYPGTGGAEETGQGAGSGFTVNVPVDAGAVDEDYQMIVGEVVVPVLRQFEPDFILVSAGFDAHGSDPLGQMRLSSSAFAAMTQDLRQVAEECCGGRIACVVEGGYNLRALEESMSAVVDALASERASGFPWPAASNVAPTRGRAAVAATKRALRQQWNL